MCLENISYNDLPQIKYAYKVFKLVENKLLPEFQPYQLKKRCWLIAINETVYNNDNVTYLSGFHCFTKVKSAANWIAMTALKPQRTLKIYKVIVKDIRLKGFQADSSTLPCVVCDQIYIMEEVKQS